MLSGFLITMGVVWIALGLCDSILRWMEWCERKLHQLMPFGVREFIVDPYGGVRRAS